MIKRISNTLNIPLKSVENTVKLLFTDSATVPFISRYRKEMTDGLDEVQIGSIKELYENLTELLKRKSTIIEQIEEQNLLSPELRLKIESCFDAKELEDIYLPYKPKRRTRAQIAKERGLEPLATYILKRQDGNITSLAKRFVSKDVPLPEDAIAGAIDIVAEHISEDLTVRGTLRAMFKLDAVLSSKVVKSKEAEAAKYADYFDYSEPLKRVPSHRLLAVTRAEKEGFLRLGATPDAQAVIERLERLYRIPSTSLNQATELLATAISDSYKRLLKPSLETEALSEARIRADQQAIDVFANNLRQLLLFSPLGEHRVLAIDPGFRTGCKVVCLDSEGNLLHNETIYPHPPQNEALAAKKKLSSLVESYQIEAIAIGNGTAGRETEELIKNTEFSRTVNIFMVSEDGASVYSASAVAREEFASYDVTVRGAVSIGRRLIDPLSELVKIDPKSIGVGQYQHDVNPTMLKKSLDTVVESCVNMVGVNLNTASKHLLAYVSGIGATLASNIISYRNSIGSFSNRTELKKVPRLGDKAYEQCAGFLRIVGSTHPLDNSSVHPESYHIVERMARDLSVSLEELIKNPALQLSIDLTRYISDTVGLPTLQDIAMELRKPGRDPRSEIKVFEFDSTIKSIEDIREGMELPAIITNITAFGAFADIGIKQDGLIHISQLANKFVSNPADVVKLHEHIRVRVLSIDKPRSRIQLKKLDD